MSRDRNYKMEHNAADDNRSIISHCISLYNRTAGYVMGKMPDADETEQKYQYQIALYC